MKKDIEKKNKFIHFLEKWVVIGVILFLIIQIGGHIVLEKMYPEYYQSSKENFSEEYMGHWYSGTFFITMTVSDNFHNMKEYKEMNQKMNEDGLKSFFYMAGIATSLTAILFIIIAAIRERKKKLTEGNTPLIIILAGISFLLYKLFEEADLFIETQYFHKYAKGFLKTVSYYPQVYLFIIPGLLIALGLVYRQIQKKKDKQDTQWNEIFIKGLVGLIITVGASFILIRFSLRLYELINLNSVTIKLPFYYYIFDLPRSFASSEASYIKLIILRFIKDLPMFICSIISIIMFVKILLSATNNKIASEENNKRYKIIFISLLIASLIFNILGLFEVHLLNAEFLNRYKDATYTIALRSLTEPLLYGFFIYIFKHYTELVSNYKNKSD